MRQIGILAAREIREGIRNRWAVTVTLAMTGFALVLALLGSAPSGTTSLSPLAVTVVSLSSLSTFFIPLIGLLLAYDSIAGEAQRGTLLLLLAHPVARWQVVLGKFAGHLVLLAVAIIVGFGVAGVAVAATSGLTLGDIAMSGFVRLVASSVLLGAVFLGLGYTISAGSRQPSTAAALAIGIWLVLVLLYDLGLLGVLVSSGGKGLSEALVGWLLLVNPTDAYRMLNLTATSDTLVVSGLAGLEQAASHSVATLVAVLTLWVVAPLASACLLLNRREF
ncbi:MAG: ABC transporter permease [Alphaproteobacteria bacterium]